MLRPYLEQIFWQRDVLVHDGDCRSNSVDNALYFLCPLQTRIHWMLNVISPHGFLVMTHVILNLDHIQWHVFQWRRESKTQLNNVRHFLHFCG